MRKLIFFVVTSLIALAFSFAKKQDVKEIKVALNGFTESQANAEVTLLQGSSDNVPENTQLWFNRDVLQGWLDLLNSTPEKDRSDGLRIYFGRSLSSAESPIHRNNEIVIVSTFKKATTIDGKDSVIHVDYFNHLDSNRLFKLTGIKGEKTHYIDASNGASLYETCKDCNAEPCNITSSHLIPRKKAERMVQDFHRRIFHNGEINSKSEWFDKWLIKFWLDQMDKNKKSRNIDDDGIRIYFSRGQDDGAFKNEARFVFVPTTLDGSIHRDDIDCDPQLRFKLKEFLEEKAKANGNTNKYWEAGPTDNGQLCPNHCSGATLPQL